MELPKKRKHDVDCPRITYDATTKVFDRLFKEESLEEMKNVVRKKLGLSSSLPLHLSQLRDGKTVVLEDDDDFDAFYAFVYSTPLAKIKVYFGDDQLPSASTAGHNASPTVHHSAADDHSPSKKRKVSFIESISEPVGGSNVEEPDSGQSLPNSEAPLQLPATIDIVSANSEEVHETRDDINKKQTGNTKGNQNKGKAVDSSLDNKSPGEQVQSDIAAVEASGSNSKNSTMTEKDCVHVSENTPYDATKSKKRPRTSTTDKSVQPATEVLDGTTAPGIDDTEGYPRSSKKSKRKHKNLENVATNLIDDKQVDTREKNSEELERHTSVGQVEVDVLTQPPKAMKKSRKKKKGAAVNKESNVSLSTSKDASNNAIVVQQPVKKQDPKPTAPSSALETNSKGKMKNPGHDQSLKTPTQLTLKGDETRLEQETKSSASVEGKPTKKKSRKKVPVELLKVNSTQDQALNGDVMAATRAAVDAILARTSLPSKEPPTRSSFVDVTALSPSIAPVPSNSSPDNQQKPPNNVSTTAEQLKCPICDQTPSHIRSRCPIIKAGVKALGQRIAELQRNIPENNDEEREKVIEELQRIMDKRTRHKPPTAQDHSMNVKSTADKLLFSSTLATDSSPAIQLPKTSKVIQPTKAPSQEIKNMLLPHFAESLSFGDVSSYTAQDLEALIRGPNLTLADVPLSDSSEDEDLEEEPSEVQDLSPRPQGRIRYPSSSEEEEEEEEASPFVPSIIPLPIKSASELSDEAESSPSEGFQGGITSFHEVNGLGSSLEVDKTGDAAVDDAYALDFAHLSAPGLSHNGRQVVTDAHILNALDENQVLEESEPRTMSDAARPLVTIATPQLTPPSDPIEASEKPESPSPQSSIVSIEDFHPLQSTPKADVAVRRSQRNNPNLVRKETDLTPKSHSASRSNVNGINYNSKSAKKTGSLTRITDLPIPINPAIGVIKPVGVQTRQQTARVEEEKAEQQGPTNPSQTKRKNGKLSAFKPSSKTTKTPAKTAKTPTKTFAKVPVPSNEEDHESRSDTVVQDALETIEPAPNNAEQSLPTWVILEGNSQLEQESFPYSQSPGFPQEPPGSEDEEDEVEASVVKPQTATRSSSKFRSLTEIASQPTLFTPTVRLTQTINTKEEVMNLYGRANKGTEESDDTDTESDSEAGAKAETSHIPVSRRAGNLLSKRG